MGWIGSLLIPLYVSFVLLVVLCPPLIINKQKTRLPFQEGGY